MAVLFVALRMVMSEVMSQAPENIARAFISYSWSSPTHESWVVNLATRLREDGVDVILDKWDLKPGHDSIKFMESMVSDSSVNKVIMICDKAYSEKANARSGGVGAESQIISPEIYGNSQQDKFAAVITEADESGKAYVPTFYRGRIYFDFLFNDRFESSYEQLLRWLIDKPQYVKPKLGSVPASIVAVNPVASATQSRARRAEEAVRQGLGSASAFVREFGDAVVSELRLMCPQIDEGQHADEVVLSAVDNMRPYLRQMIELGALIARFSDDYRIWDAYVTQMERMASLSERDDSVVRWHPYQYDAYKILTHDLFLSVLSCLLDESKFDFAEVLFSKAWLGSRLVQSQKATAAARLTADRKFRASLS
jgi:hypothetical protein